MGFADSRGACLLDVALCFGLLCWPFEMYVLSISRSGHLYTSSHIFLPSQPGHDFLQARPRVSSCPATAPAINTPSYAPKDIHHSTDFTALLPTYLTLPTLPSLSLPFTKPLLSLLFPTHPLFSSTPARRRTNMTSLFVEGVGLGLFGFWLVESGVGLRMG